VTIDPKAFGGLFDESKAEKAREVEDAKKVELTE